MLIFIAKKAFIDLGEHLQRCRRNDYWDTFSLFLENKEDDPALKDMELAEKLMQNKRIGEKKLSDTFEEYVKKQEEMKDQITHPKRSENEEDDDDSIENNDDEEEDDDNDEADDNGISDIDVNLDTDNDKSSSSEDENSTDRSETSKNKTNTEAKSNTGEANSDIEMGEIYQQEINDRLKDHKGDNLKSSKVNDFVNTSNYKNDFKSESIIQNDTISAPNVTKHLNITTNIAFSTTTDNKILIDRTKG